MHKFVLNELPTVQAKGWDLPLDRLNEAVKHKITTQEDKYNLLWNTAYYPEERLQYSFLYMLGEAYASHKDIVINPHDLWYMMLNMTATVVNAEPERYRALFTREPEGSDKKDIVIESEEGNIDIDLLFSVLVKEVPIDINLFLPKFSNLTKGAATACMAAFCDMVQAFYRYGIMCCGIRSITFGGELEDWQLFLENFACIAYHLNKADEANLVWTSRIGSHIDSIIAAIEQDDPTFIKGIYSHENAGSGPQLEVDGWIGDFTVNGRGRCLDHYTTMISKVPYHSLFTGKHYMSVFGSFSSWETQNGFETLYSGIGFEKVGKIEVANKIQIAGKYEKL